MPARILVGSCSWTDPSLIACGRFYPSGVTSAEARLRYYAGQFGIVEVDSTYYAPPSARNSALWAARTPADFVFNVKAFAWLTHHAAAPDRLPDWLRSRLPDEVRGKRSVYARDVGEREMELVWQLHREALEPLADGGQARRGALPVPALVRPLARERRLPARRCPSGCPDGRSPSSSAAAAGWTRAPPPGPSAFSRRWGSPTSSVDEPQGFASSTPAVVAATAPLAIVRLHGRNAATWDAKTEGRIRPLQVPLRDAELEEWVPEVRELAGRRRRVHVLFNNNYEDWGMQNARRMALLLGVESRPPQEQLELG